MSIRFVYTPRFVGTALNATKQTLAMVKHAATRRLNAIVTATRVQKSLDERDASGSFSETAFYISPTGTGTAAGGGTLADPWPISMLRDSTAQARYAGKRVWLMDGSYPIPVNHTDFTVPYWNVAGGTDNNNRTIIQALNPRLAILDGLVGGTGSTYAAQACIGTDDQWVTFKDLEIKRGAQKLLQILASNVTVDGCHIHDMDSHRVGAGAGDNTDLIRTEGSVGARITGIIIRNCLLHDVANSAGGTWTSSSANAACLMQYNTEGLIFENNTCYNAGTACGEKINSAATTARWNFIYQVRNAMFALGSDSANTVWDGTPSSYTVNIHNNVAVNVEIWHETDADGFIAAATGLAQITNVYNNTVYGQSPISGNATYWTAFRDGCDADVYNAKNNIFHLTTSSGGGLVHENTAGKAVSCINGATTNYNLYPGTLRWLSGTYTTLAAWRTATGGEANSATTNPNFVSAGTLTPESYKISGAALTAGDTGGPVGAYITQSETIGCGY
jgi:hypothetical protein